MPTKLALAAPVDDGPLLAMADAQEPKLIRGFVRALTSMRDRVSVDEVLGLLMAGQWDRVLELFTPAEFTVAKAAQPYGPDSEFLASIYQSLFEGGADHAAQEMRAFGVGLDFRINRDDAARWAEQHAGSQIVQIQRETRQIVQQMIAMGIREGVPPRTLATQIAHSVGLTPQHAVALRNFTTAAEQAAAQGGQVGWMRDRWSLSPQWSGRPASVESAVNRYSDRLISWRAETIARTETLTSLHQGQLEGWREMERQGLFENQRVVRHWQISNDDRLCDVCAPMAGETSTLSEKWQSTERGLPGGETVEHVGPVVETPPLHPRCRCTEFITLEVSRTDGRNVPEAAKPTKPEPRTRSPRAETPRDKTQREARERLERVARGKNARNQQIDDATDLVEDNPLPLERGTLKDRYHEVDDLSGREGGAMEQYTGPRYADVNEALYADDWPDGADRQALEQLIDDLVRGVDTLARDTAEKELVPDMVWRGVSRESAQALGQLQPGDTTLFPSFTSTSGNYNTAAGFGNSNTVIEILPLRGAGGWTGHAGETGWAETEYLIQRGSEFRVMGWDRVVTTDAKGYEVITKVLRLEQIS